MRTKKPACDSDGVALMEEERESDYVIVGVADDASYQDQINGIFD